MLENETKEHSALLTVLAVNLPSEVLTLKMMFELDDFCKSWRQWFEIFNKRHCLSPLVQLGLESPESIASTLVMHFHVLTSAATW